MPKLKNWLGEYMNFDGKLGQAIANHQITNLPGGYIYDDGFINLAADPEIPIKGLIILGTSKSASSITDFSQEERFKISEISNKLISVLHEIGFEKIINFQDEGTSGQFHIWFLPRHDWTFQFNCNLDDMIKYSSETLNISKEYKDELLQCIQLIKYKFKNYILKN